MIDDIATTEGLPENFKLEFIEKDFPDIERKVSPGKESKITRKYIRVRNSFEIAG